MKYYGGCDSGSTYTKCVIIDETGKMVADVTLRSRINAVLSCEESIEKAVAQVPELTSADDLAYLVGTGYGRNKVPSADENISEISCHAMGVHVADPNVKAIIDIGGQDVKGIAIDSDGTVLNFAMNDKCAAGTGRFLEMMARTLEVDIEDLGVLSLKSTENIEISSMCSVFAESEVISLIAQNKETSDIAHGIHMAIAAKAISLMRRVGLEPGYMMTGGVAKNPGVVKVLEEQLKAPLYISGEPEIVGALGAALYGLERVL